MSAGKDLENPPPARQGFVQDAHAVRFGHIGISESENLILQKVVNSEAFRLRLPHHPLERDL